MNAIGKLIKSKVVNFVEALLKNYYKMNIDELEVVILCKLYYLSEDDDLLDISKLAMTMNINENELSDKVLKLVSNGFLDLSISDTGRESFNLDGSFDKLGLILCDEQNSDPLELNVKIVVEYIETTFQKVCSSSDLVLINQWLREGFDVDKIKEAVLKSAKLNKTNLKYTDAILNSRKIQESKESIVIDDEIKALLDRAYVKKK